jgi:hypothetical protein
MSLYYARFSKTRRYSRTSFAASMLRTSTVYLLASNAAYQPRRALRAVGWMRLFGTCQ